MKRVINTTGAVFLGLGSIIGTGIFVSVGLAIGVAGYLVIPAILIATLVAVCNGMSSARLASVHPVSGGTYEYGYKFLSPVFGFTAGWSFFIAKSASAATAALGFAGYIGWLFSFSSGWHLSSIGFAAVIILTALVAGGIRRSDKANRWIVSLTLSALGIFTVFGIWFSDGIPDLLAADTYANDFSGFGWAGMFHAAALMFVAFTGYGRVATLGEEVENPAKTIPKAVIITLLATMAIYITVTLTAMSLTDADTLAEAARDKASPLYAAATFIPGSFVSFVIIAGGATAMLGVLLNLILGISRVVLAASRRGDMPESFRKINTSTGSPVKAVWLTGGIIAFIVLVGNVYTAWSFSAFTVLIYYAITNLSAIRLKRAERKMPVLVPVAGLLGCLGLAFWVDTAVWISGLIVILAGLGWHYYRRVSGS